jgi:uncharacterized protein (DUF427 family)
MQPGTSLKSSHHTSCRGKVHPGYYEHSKNEAAKSTKKSLFKYKGNASIYSLKKRKDTNRGAQMG